MEILVLGVERVVVVKVESEEPYLAVKYRVLPLPQDGGSELEALNGALLELAAKAISLAQPQTSRRNYAHAGGQRRSVEDWRTCWQASSAWMWSVNKSCWKRRRAWMRCG